MEKERSVKTVFEKGSLQMFCIRFMEYHSDIRITFPKNFQQ